VLHRPHTRACAGTHENGVFVFAYACNIDNKTTYPQGILNIQKSLKSILLQCKSPSSRNWHSNSQKCRSKTTTISLPQRKTCPFPTLPMRKYTSRSFPAQIRLRTSHGVLTCGPRCRDSRKLSRARTHHDYSSFTWDRNPSEFTSFFQVLAVR
jgi:hypothetical protein